MAIWSDLLARAGAKAKARGRIAIYAGRRHAVAVAGTHTDGTTSVLPSPSFTGESAAIQALAWQQAQPGRWAGSVVLHPMDYRILQLDAPKVPEAERRDALRWLMRDQIDFAIEDASIDGVEVPGPSLGTRSDKIIAVVAPAERIRDWMQRYRQQRCALETIDIPEFAMRNLAVLATGQSAAALVHIGLRVTRVTIVWQQELCAFRQLELSARQLADATEPERLAILDRLALDIQRTADAFTRQFHGADLKKPHEVEWLDSDPTPFEAGRFLSYAGRGCHRCHDTGYLGRMAVYEMMEMTPALMHLANQDDTAGFVAEARRAFADYTLRRAAMDLVMQGRTTVAEAMRISSTV